MGKFERIAALILESVNANIDIQTFVKKPFKKHAIKAETPGKIMTRQGEAEYEAGDYLAFDAQGGQYPIKASEFDKLYAPTDDPEYWLSKPVKVQMFKTNEEMQVETPWGTYTASPGDWIQIKMDGTYGAPRKPDVIETDYEKI